MRQCSGGMLRWKGRNKKCAQMAGEEERAPDLSRCRDLQVTKETSVLWSGWAGE